MILSAVYMLWMFQRVNYGPVTNPKNRGLRDLSVREWFVIAPICAMAIFMGVVPGVFLKPMEPAVRKTVRAHRRRAGAGQRRAQAPCRRRDRRPTGPAAASPVAARDRRRTPRREDSLMVTRTDFAAIVPVLIVTLSACAVLLAEAFRRKDERMPLGLLGVIGLVGAIVTSILLWGRDAHRLRRHRRRQLRALLQRHDLRASAC